MKNPVRHLTKKRALLAVVALALLGAGIGVWASTGNSATTPGIVTTTSLETITTGTISQSVSATGTIEPASTADLDFAVSGRVTAVDVAAGQTVTAGQALATVDDTALSAALVQAQATLADAESQLSTDETADASSEQLASDQATITSDATAVTTARTDLADATLTSTIAGTVASVDLTVGEQVSGSSGGSSSGGSAGATGAATTATSTTGSSSSSSSSSQVVVVSTGSYVVDASVAATDVSEVKVGDQATVTVSGSTAPVYGTVASVGLVASTSSTTATFPVVIDITGSPSGLYGGSSATVAVTVKKLEDVVEVPTAALQYSGSSTTVELDVDGTRTTRDITTGTASGDMTQVVSGLAAGDKVYVTQISFRGRPSTGSGSGSGFGSGSAGGLSGGSGGFPSGGTGGPPSGGGFGG